jgi:hypothetical protein
MNKLVNLLIIFVCLQYLIPILKLDILLTNSYLINISISLIIGLIQFIYNYIMKFSNRKEINFKENLIDSSLKSVIVLSGIYIFNQIQIQNNDLLSKLEYNKFFKSLFITLLITFFILIKCLITP